MQTRVHQKLPQLLVLVNVALGGALVLVSIYASNTVAILTVAALSLAQASLLGAWVVLGTTPLPLRMGATALALGLIAYCWLTVCGIQGDMSITRSAMLFTAPAIASAAGVLALRRAGLRLVVHPVEGAGCGVSLQISIRGLFLLTLVVAIVLAAIKNLPTTVRTEELASICAICLAETMISLWQCLGQRPGYRLFLAVPLAGIATLPIYYFEGWPVVAVMGMTFMFMVASLLVLRYGRWRIVVPEEGQPATEIVPSNLPAPGAALLL